MSDWAERLGGSLGLVVWALVATGELLHIIFTLMDKAYVLLVIGFFIPPIGVVNGFGQLLGVW